MSSELKQPPFTKAFDQCLQMPGVLISVYAQYLADVMI